MTEEVSSLNHMCKCLFLQGFLSYVERDYKSVPLVLENSFMVLASNLLLTDSYFNNKTLVYSALFLKKKSSVSSRSHWKVSIDEFLVNWAIVPRHNLDYLL